MTASARMQPMSGLAVVAGIGETDYARDYGRARAGERYTDAYGYAATAFRRALADSGLRFDDIDGLVAGPTTATERLGEVLGLDCRWSTQADSVNAVIEAVMALHCGLAECIALVYGNDQRTAGTAYGGPTAMGGERFLAYVQYAPWGLTSQGALYAMMINRYMYEADFRPDDLARIVIGQRMFAASNPNAIMHKSVDLDAYLASPLICEPLRMFDYCLVNDGGVALILTTKERLVNSGKPVVSIAGLARSDMNIDATSLRPRLLDYYHPAHQDVANDVFRMAGVGPNDIDVLQIYDSFSAHIPFVLEGFGFCKPGDAAQPIRDGWLMPGGRLPTNTSGGMLSESYMQGWNHQIEAVRQLRGEAGARQVEGARHAQYASDVAGKAASILYVRN